MQKIKLKNNQTYNIADFASLTAFTILRETTSSISSQLTRENLAEIKFLTENNVVTGVYKDKQLVSCTDVDDNVKVVICDRYDIVIKLDSDNRIISVEFPKYAQPEDTVVEKLPEGNINDYKYVNEEFIYDPLPQPPAPPTTEDKVKEHEQLINTLLMNSASEFERGYKETTEIQMALAQLFELVAQLQAQHPS